ncbi:hypothetical protein AAFF_G00192330 [Aldrovandia affinis]|uniref:Uncharacterized protein n=1 Tax=Aldrovandia affinis TaxID=143900 RepID=A0AAD7W642_9TELE|nr:hypothetical protein AAFF_G00192330 [Aldrovandia affinis]
MSEVKELPRGKRLRGGGSCRLERPLWGYDKSGKLLGARAGGKRGASARTQHETLTDSGRHLSQSHLSPEHRRCVPGSHSRLFWIRASDERMHIKSALGFSLTQYRIPLQGPYRVRTAPHDMDPSREISVDH